VRATSVWLKAVIVMVLALAAGSALAQRCADNVADSAPDSRYQMNADGTVLDLQTGLMWMRCAMGQTWDSQQGACTGDAATYVWQDALGAAQSLDQSGGFAGYTDWRVPNYRALTSIARYRCHNPAINSKAFPNTPGMEFWTATPVSANYGSGWAVSFTTGQVGYLGFNNTFAVRLVRAGAFQLTPPASTAP